jgi:hypothetical protein
VTTRELAERLESLLMNSMTNGTQYDFTAVVANTFGDPGYYLMRVTTRDGVEFELRIRRA